MSNFAIKTRTDGSTFVALTDDHRDRMEGSPVFRGVRAAHDVFDMPPNDFLYSVCMEVDEDLHEVDLSDSEAVEEHVWEVCDMIAARYMHDRTEYHRWAASNPHLESWGEELTALDFGGESVSPATTVFTLARYAAQAYADEIVADHERCEAIGSRFVSAG